MKISRFLLALMIVLALVGVSTHSARAFAFTYTSGFQVQNIDPTNPASVQINFFAPDGSQPSGSAITDSIPAASSKTYFPLTGLPNGFTGSVVVSSSTRTAAVVNILGSGTTNAAASYVGASSGSASVLLPLLMKNNGGFNTWFSVQNTGSATTDIKATYSDGTSVTKTSVASGAAAVFDQSTETHPVKVFSAVVSSPTSVLLAASVIEENPSTMFAYSGFANTGSTVVVMPLINANNSGYATGVQILNAGGSSTNVTVSYTPAGAGTACTETQPIAAGKSATFALLSFGGNPIPNGGTTNCIGHAKFVGSAKVTTNSASQPLVAIVNQLKAGVNGEAYDAFDPSTATKSVVLPLIMDRNGGFYTGFTIMNVGPDDTVNCTFTNTSYTVSKLVPTNTAFVSNQGGLIGVKYVGSATCTAAANGKLIAIVNELNPTAAGDNLLVYEGIPVTP